MMRGHFIRSEFPDQPYRTTPPAFTLAEQDALAETYARWWRDYYLREGCEPSRMAALRANIPGIGRSKWIICLFHDYCADTGMLRPPRLGVS